MTCTDVHDTEDYILFYTLAPTMIHTLKSPKSYPESDKSLETVYRTSQSHVVLSSSGRLRRTQRIVTNETKLTLSFTQRRGTSRLKRKIPRCTLLQVVGVTVYDQDSSQG